MSPNGNAERDEEERRRRVRERDPRDEEQCGSTRTVEVGPMASIDLRCVLKRWAHAEPLHMSSRRFGDVDLVARWSGPFERP